jgi:hypothetical protein
MARGRTGALKPVFKSWFEVWHFRFPFLITVSVNDSAAGNGAAQKEFGSLALQAARNLSAVREDLPRWKPKAARLECFKIPVAIKSKCE